MSKNKQYGTVRGAVDEGDPGETNGTPSVAAPDARDVGAELAPWVRAGVLGVINDVRLGAATHGSAILDTYADSIATAVASGDYTADTAIREIIPEADVGITDVRVLDTDELPPPRTIPGRLQPVRAWPHLLYAPTGIVLAVAYKRTLDGRHVIVSVCRRHVAPRAKRTAA